MVSWDDVLFGALTGGAYNAAKAAAQAGDAVGQIGDDIGKSVAITTEKVLTLLDELTAFVTELDQMLVIKRLTPRDENDLWDEDKERLAALRNLEASYEATYLQYGGADTTRSTLVQSIVDMMMGRGAPVLGLLALKIIVVRNAINDIYFNEPGVIPETIYQVKSVIERFHTLEQPRIETLMDTTTDTIEEGHEILTEVKKLFVIRKYTIKPLASLSPEDMALHVQLMARKARFDDLVAKNRTLADSLQKRLADIRVSAKELPGSVVKAGVPPGTRPAGVHEVFDPVHGIIPSAGVSASPGMQAHVNAELKNSQVVALLGAGNVLEGRLLFYEREQLKVDKSLFRLTHVLEEVPGVIPNTLDEVYLSIKRFRTEEQPRIERIMDSSNAMLLETTVVLHSVDQVVIESKTLLEKVQGWFDFLSDYRIPLLIVCGCVAVLFVAIMVMVLVVLVKIAFF